MDPFVKQSDINNLSDDSDSSLEMLSLAERVQFSISKEKKKRCKSVTNVLPAHTISDSEESIGLPEIDVSPKLHSSSPINLLNQPVMKLEVTISDTEEEFQSLADVPKKLKIENLNNLEILSDISERNEQNIADDPKKFKKTTKKVKDIDKELEKERKLKIREEKKREKELSKAIKASEKEVQKSKKPEECLKNMKIVIDHNMIFLDGAQDAFTVLDSDNIKYSIEENNLKCSVVWYRTISNIAVENNQVVKEEREEIDNNMVVLIPNNDFLHMIQSTILKNKLKNSEKLTLLEHIVNIKTSYPKMNINCVIAGFNKYMRDLKEGNNDEMKRLAKQVPKLASEEAIVEVQLQAFVNFNFVNDMAEFGSLLCKFTKSISEAPIRREKQKQKALAFSWFADADSSCPVKISKDGSGLMKLWQQQLKQFQNVGAEIAEAIASKYPSPQILLQAYKNCTNTKEAEILLQDIVVRRSYGPLGTQRRIGPELSYKIYLFFHSKNGSQVLQR